MTYGKSISVIIPSLNPSEELVRVVTGLAEAGFEDIIVVNDGSGAEYAAHFEEIAGFPQTTVLTHPKNLGKGASLKTAFRFIKDERASKAGVITADGDGQHLINDVVKCALALMESDGCAIMGARSFNNPKTPTRNLLGNRIAALAFRILFGIKLRDTQTGLRGITAYHIPHMLEIPGSRFDYETNMLLEFKRRGIPLKEIEIETVYAERANKSSHFRPIIDSIMIFARIFKYALSGAFSFIVDIGIFWCAMTFLGGFMGVWSIAACTAIARTISSFFNFNVNRRLVFQRKQAYSRHLRRYYLLAVIQMSVSAGALWLLSILFDGTQVVWLLTILKILIDTVLFFLSYRIQQKWVFN